MRINNLLVAQSALATATTSPCKTTTLQPTTPSPNTSYIALHSYSYCGGLLNATAFVQNQGNETGAAVTLFYADGEGQSTPMSVIGMTFAEELDENFELWTTSTPVYYDGVTGLLNVTVQSLRTGEVYVDMLDERVEASGDPIPDGPIPPLRYEPYATPKGFGDDITAFLAVHGTAAETHETLSAYSTIALEKMFANINPDYPGAERGVVVAAGVNSSALINIGYRYHWVRDSSLTMDMVQMLYSGATTTEGRDKYADLLFEYAAARKKELDDPILQTGQGEPKFYLNNTVWPEPWSRPQNDGPATVAITLLGFAEQYLANGGSIDEVRQSIYGDESGRLQGPVLSDLLFVASNWSSTSYDIWEAVPSTQHFYNALVSRRALLLGADFARNMMKNVSTATKLSTAAEEITQALSYGHDDNKFWHPLRQALMYQVGPVLRGKSSYLDSAVILGVVHGYNDDGVFGWTNDQVLSTVWRLASSFADSFNLADEISRQNSNRTDKILGMPIGRFPEDMYNGTGRAPNGGNPWYMTTASYAQLMYSASKEYSDAGCITVSETSAPFFQYFAPRAHIHLAPGETFHAGDQQFDAVIDSLNGWGDAFMRTIEEYILTEDGANHGRMTEQFDRNTGVQRGAEDLTWSYASLLLAAKARARARGEEKQFMGELADFGAAHFL